MPKPSRVKPQRDKAAVLSAMQQAHNAMEPLHDNGMDEEALLLGFVLAVDQACQAFYGLKLQHPEVQARFKKLLNEINPLH